MNVIPKHDDCDHIGFIYVALTEEVIVGTPSPKIAAINQPVTPIFKKYYETKMLACARCNVSWFSPVPDKPIVVEQKKD